MYVNLCTKFNGNRCLLGLKNGYCHDRPGKNNDARADLRLPKLAFSSRRLSIEERIRASFVRGQTFEILFNPRNSLLGASIFRRSIFEKNSWKNRYYATLFRSIREKNF